MPAKPIQGLWRVAIGVICTSFVATGLYAANTPPQDQVAASLFQQLDLSRPDLKDVAALVHSGKPGSALDLWRDQVVMRLRAHDFHEYGWHGYVLHPRPAGAVDRLVGLTTQQQYLDCGMVGFVDIFGMSGPPGTVKKINWFADVNGPIDWGKSGIDKLSTNLKLLQTDYANFEFAKPFVGRYWTTGNVIYLRKAFEIMSDFSRNHAREFWQDYRTKGIDDKAVRDIYRCDWRLNTNGLGVGWRLKNFLKIMAGLCKCLGPDKPKNWDDILHPVPGPLTRQQLDLIPADQLAEIALSLMRDYTGKLLWFCVRDGAVPNQRAEGLKALAFLSVIFPNFKQTPQLIDYIDRGYENMLSSNFLPDGGSLEQSFNYNAQDKEGLEELVHFFGDQPPAYAKTALEKVKARRAVDDGLQTPLGGLPQVGNGHDVLGKNVWESDAAAKRYWDATDIEGKSAVRPQTFTSIAYPYSGYYALRSDWGMKDLYLFFMNGRPQTGHSMRDNNAIQMTAYGRQLVVCGGSPTYGMDRTPEAKGADFYLSEASSLKNNTVIVDGQSQAKNAPYATRAYRTPVPSRWYTSPRYDLVDGLYKLGYAAFKDGHDVDIDMTVEHYRKVIFVKVAKLWLIQDRMISMGTKSHEYTQIWNFLPYHADPNYAKTIAGFKEDQFKLDQADRRFRTTDPDGPNVEFLHYGPAHIEYQKYFGHRDPWLGWYAAGIGDARPAVDVHVNWRSSDGDRLTTLMIPLDKGETTPVTATVPLNGANRTATGMDVSLRGGLRLRYLSADTAQKLDLAPVTATAQSLLVCTETNGALSGIAMECSALSVKGKPVPVTTASFEFDIAANGTVTMAPVFVPEVPVIREPPPFANIADAPPVTISGSQKNLTIHYTRDGSDPTAQSPVYTGAFKLTREATVKARFFDGTQPLPLVGAEEYRARHWPLRVPDRENADGLEPGLRFGVRRFDNSIRLWDLMQRPPTETGTCVDLSLDRWKKDRNFGVKWHGYLRIPHDGIYRFYCHTITGADLFLYNPDKDLQVPPVVSANYRDHDGDGSMALKTGFHQLQVEYMQAWNNPNDLSIEIEGPGVPKQPLGAQWLFRDK